MPRLVLGAAEDESSSVSGGIHATLALRWHVEDEHVSDEPVKDVTQIAAGDVLGASEGGS